jgi:hypothetical protein
MWILKNSKELLENLKSRGFSKNVWFLHTLYNNSHNILKARLFQIIDNCFLNKKWHPEIQSSSDWETRYVFCETPLW